MTAARALPRLPVPLTNAMAALDRAGFELLPLGAGPDGKAPLMPFAGRTFSLSGALRAMAARGSLAYGVRLDGLVVADLDDVAADLVAEIVLRFGPSPVAVKTRRGLHLWYRAPEAPLPNLRAEGLFVDLKSGRNAYVVGPGFTLPNGTAYRAIRGDLATDSLPVLRLPETPRSPVQATTGLRRTPEGERHAALIRAALDLARRASTEDAMTAELLAFRDHRLDRPETVPDAEVAGVAAWAWECRLENRLWTGRNSGFNLNRRAIDALKGDPAQDQALGLLARLTAAHGHTAARFPLDHAAMKAADLTSMGRPAFLAARRALEKAGLLRCVQKHVAGKSPALWMLSLPPD